MINFESSPAVQTQPTSRTRELYEAAQKLEAGFLAEMLEAAGLGQSNSAFGGGAGETQFASFLVQEQELQMVRAGGIGLTEALFHSLEAQQND